MTLLTERSEKVFFLLLLFLALIHEKTHFAFSVHGYPSLLVVSNCPYLPFSALFFFFLSNRKKERKGNNSFKLGRANSADYPKRPDREKKSKKLTVLQKTQKGNLLNGRKGLLLLLPIFSELHHEAATRNINWVLTLCLAEKVSFFSLSPFFHCWLWKIGAKSSY